MEKFKHMVDMARSLEKAMEQNTVMAQDAPIYPHGLAIRLTQDELDKLGVDHKDWGIGDIFHLHGLAKVTSVSSHASEGGDNCCVELQFTHLSGESEDAENEEDEANEDAGEESDEGEEPKPKKAKGRPNHYF